MLSLLTSLRSTNKFSFELSDMLHVLPLLAANLQGHPADWSTQYALSSTISHRTHDPIPPAGDGRAQCEIKLGDTLHHQYLPGEQLAT